MIAVGECRVRQQRNERTLVYELHIDHADPHVLITTEVLDQAIYKPNDMLWMDYSNEQTCFDDHEHSNLHCFRLRAVLHIKGVNREVLYRVTPHPERTDVYEGHCPD